MYNIHDLAMVSDGDGRGGSCAGGWGGGGEKGVSKSNKCEQEGGPNFSHFVRT